MPEQGALGGGTGEGEGEREPVVQHAGISGTIALICWQHSSLGQVRPVQPAYSTSGSVAFGCHGLSGLSDCSAWIDCGNHMVDTKRRGVC